MLIMTSLPTDSPFCFSDGSCLGIPGPCGTGGLVFMPEHRHLLESLKLGTTGSGTPEDDDKNQRPSNAHGGERRPARGFDDEPTPRAQSGKLADGPLAVYTGLLTEGEGSNNIAELWGPAMLLQLLEWHEKTTGEAHGGPIAIFTDSQLTIDIIRYRARPKANAELAHAVRRLIRVRGHRNSIAIYWVPGHADVAENEMVDELANWGAEQSQNGVGINVAQAIANNRYLPDGQSPYHYHKLNPMTQCVNVTGSRGP